MAVPTITTLSPTTGPTTGRTFVEIVGADARLPPTPPVSGPTTTGLPTTVEVLLNGRAATRTRVRSDPANPPSGTIVTCLTPPVGPGSVDIVLRNLDDSGVPIAGETVTAAAAFTYARHDLTQEPDFTRLVRTLLRELKAQVIENINLTVSTDYDASTSDGLNITELSQLPAIVLIGPRTEENRFFSLNESPEVGGGDAPGLPFSRRQVPYTVDLRFDLIAVSDHKVELLALMNLCTLFFHHNKFLEIDRDPLDPSAGRVRYEMDFEGGGQFQTQSRPNASNVRHFSGTFVVRGFDIDAALGITVEQGVTSDAVTLTSEPIGAGV